LFIVLLRVLISELVERTTQANADAITEIPINNAAVICFCGVSPKKYFKVGSFTTFCHV
jgi:hypothetical protein